MRKTEKIIVNKFLIYFFTVFFVLICKNAFALPPDSFVNLQYLERETKTSITYKWEIDEIVIAKKGRVIRIFLNIPYIIFDKYHRRLDTPPFSENGIIYISQYTFDQIVMILGDEEDKKDEKLLLETVKELKKPEETKEKKIIETKKEESFAVKETQVLKIEKTPVKTLVATPTLVPTSSIQSKKKTRVVVLDPGHGGHDPGAIGPNGVKEKDIVLDITLRVVKYLKQENFRIYLTREDDTFIPLKRRAVFANEKDADLFISIHCNASKNRGAQGIRTYIYNRIASSREAAELAKLENKDVGTFELLLNDLRKSAFEYLSIEAAGNIQHCLVKNLKLKWAPTERAPFYVLANTNMPSVLVETAFISNPYEERKLDDNDFREKIAKGIADGVLEYFSKLK